MLKSSFSKGKLNLSLAAYGVIGAVVPIVATIATGGLAAVGLPLWVALGAAVSGLAAGNVEPKSATIKVLEAEHAKTDGV